MQVQIRWAVLFGTALFDSCVRCRSCCHCDWLKLKIRIMTLSLTTFGRPQRVYPSDPENKRAHECHECVQSQDKAFA